MPVRPTPCRTNRSRPALDMTILRPMPKAPVVTTTATAVTAVHRDT